MSKKVICDRADICKDGCHHDKPHDVETFDFDGTDGSPRLCTDFDECLNYKVRCVQAEGYFEFDLEGMFEL